MASEFASVVNPHSESINQKMNIASFTDILKDIDYWIQYVETRGYVFALFYILNLS